MFLKQLFESDNSFELVSLEKWDQEIVGVSTPSYLRANTLIFIKKKNFYKKIQEKQQEIPENVGIVFEKKLWDDLKEEADFQAFSYVGIADDLTMLMTTVSKILFAELNDGVDFFADGRSKDKVTVGKNTLIGENVFLGENVVIGENVKIYPGAVVMPNVEIGDHCEIFSNVTIYGQTRIGKSCRIHAGTTIGSDGFGYNFYNGQHLKLWHSGGVIIEDGVEIGSNSCVDMGTFTPTIIRGGTKIDNQVQVAHNVELGQGVILCGQTGIAGSCTVGPYTVMGGQTGVSHDIHIGSQCQIGGFSAVTSNVTDGAKIAGFPARPFNEWLAGLAYVRRNSLKKR